MKKKYKGIKISNVIISILFIFLGIDNLITGAHTDGSLYLIDGILVRALGMLFIVSSLGLLLRKDLARKCAIIISIVSIVENISTFQYIDLLVDIPISFLIIVIVYGIPLFFLLNSKVKLYFISKKHELESIYNDESSNLRSSRFGIASFVPALINILLVVLDGLLNAQTLETIIGTEAVYVAITSLLGIIFGITGLTDKNSSKTLSILGSALNGCFLIVFIFLIFAVL